MSRTTQRAVLVLLAIIALCAIYAAYRTSRYDGVDLMHDAAKAAAQVEERHVRQAEQLDRMIEKFKAEHGSRERDADP